MHNVQRKTIRRAALSALFCSFLAMPTFAQKAGDMISGNVSDDIEGLMMVNVVEIDASNRVVAHGVTDVNGNFSFRIHNPKDKLRISYVGYETQIIPIRGTSYKIRMKNNTQIKEVVIKGSKITPAMGGLPIPERELTMASQTIDMKEFEGMSMTSVDEALQGRIAGLDIIANSGDLGAGMTMRLRGVSSIYGNSEPLIVVDGNIFESDYQEGFDFYNATEDQFAELLNVNPNDIQSITVLKDAAGTALWGVRGGNGVIEIRTKRGQKGPTQVQYSYFATLTHQPEGMRILNGDQYTMLMKEAYYNPRLSDAASDIREFNYDPSFSEYEQYNNNTDWLGAVKKNGLEQQHYVTLSGGGEKARFRIGAGYDHQTGTVIMQKLQRFTTRVAFDYFISDRITVQTNFNLTYSDNKKNAGGLLEMAYKKMPNLAIYEQDADGNDTPFYYHMLQSANSAFNGNQKGIQNPVALAHEAKSEQEVYRIQPEFVLKYKLLGTTNESHQLDYEGRIRFDIENVYDDSFNPSSLVTEGWTSSSANKPTSNANKSRSLTTTHRLTFTPHFNNENHSLMTMFQFQLTDGNSKSQSNSSYGLPYGSIQSTIADGVISGMSTGTGQNRSMNMLVTAHYAYKGKYMADLTVRRDGNTSFGEDKRWGTFPAISFRWNVTDEPWMQNVKWLSMLSIRPSWGYAGNLVGGYLYLSKYASGESYNGNGSIYPSNIRLNNLQWESHEDWNLGFDFGLFDGMITGDVNMYLTNITKMLMPNRAISSSTGFTSFAYQNLGEMRNSGWEFRIDAHDFVKIGKKFRLSANISFNNNRNVLTEMDPTVLANMNGEFSRNNGSYLSRVQLNNAYGSIYGFRYKGVYQYSKYTPEEVPGVSGPNAPVARDAEGNVIIDKYGLTVPMVFCYNNQDNTYIYEFKGGDAIYEDVNHDGQINELDIVYLGNSLPKVTGGWGFKVDYGPWSLNAQFNFRFGNKIVNGARMNAESMYSNENQSTAVNWRWRVEGDIAPIPRALHDAGYNYLGSDRFVESGSFMRLNSLVLNYRLSPTLLKQIGVKGLTLSLNARNLFVLSRYSGCEPEVSPGRGNVATDNAKTPRSRTYSLRAVLTF